MVTRVLASLLMLLSSLAPAGSRLCVAPNGHAEWEMADRACCEPTARPGEAFAPLRIDDCDGCSDVVFSEATAKPEASAAAPVTTHASLPAVRGVLPSAPLPTISAIPCGRLTPARMAEIRSVVIRC